MSCVVGIVSPDGVWIGCDNRASTEDGEIRPIMVEKVFQNGPYLIGFIGSVRGGQIVRPEYFTAPKQLLDWPDELRNQCAEKGCLASHENSTQMMQGNFIIGYKGHLYEIMVDFQLNEIAEYTAIGSGSSYAFGSLYTTGELDIEPFERIEYALNTAGEFDAATGPPYRIYKLDE